MNTSQAVPIQQDPTQVLGQVLCPGSSETRTNPKTRPGYKIRQVTSVTQALLGTIIVICGIVVGASRSLEGDQYRLGRHSIWIGIVAIVTSVFGFLNRGNKVLVSIHMVSSIFSSLVAFVGMTVTATALRKSSSVYYIMFTCFLVECLVASLAAGSSFAGLGYFCPLDQSRRRSSGSKSTTLTRSTQQHSGNSAYIELDDQQPSVANSAYMESNAGGRPQIDSAYLEPNAVPQGNQSKAHPYDYVLR